MDVDKERRDIAASYLKERPGMFSSNLIASVMEQRVIVGMNSQLARLAGGSCSFKVEADPKWPEHTNPITVIEAQTQRPDESKIDLFFCNDTQYPAEGRCSFTVRLEHGVVIAVTRSGRV